MTPPPESFEKRQRARKKQRKREDKRQRRLQRAAEKRVSRGRSTVMYHTLRRGDSQHLVDSDIWLCVLDIAAFHGWTPLADTREAPADVGSYTRPQGLTIASGDAQGIAQSIEAELPRIADEELPLSDLDFGEEHTDVLLAMRSDGKVIAENDAIAARELLSGPPKREAARLASFLKGGAFSVDLD